MIVWVHGGAWRAGSRKDMPLTKLVTAGYAIASVDYRLSITARFPAQVHDLKAAIRYLRANATKLGLNADKIAIAGASAGAHLAALVGVTNGHRELEGTVGVTGPSSDVHAIVSFFGMSDLTTILSQSTTHGLSVRVPALQLLLGGQPDAVPVLARLASPVFHVDASDPRSSSSTATKTRRPPSPNPARWKPPTKERNVPCNSKPSPAASTAAPNSTTPNASLSPGNSSTPSFADTGRRRLNCETATRKLFQPVG